MKKVLINILFLGVFCVVSPLYAADWQQDINELRKDVRELHQKLYSIDEKPVSTENSGNAQMRDKIDEYGATLHRINERMDELEKKIKQYNDNLDKFNQKTDVRLKVLENRKMSTEETSIMTSSPVISNSAPINGGIVNGNKPEDMYASAMQAYNNALYDEAELGFEDVIKQFPSHALAGNSQYWLGEVYTKQGNLNKAKQAFKSGYEKYKNGNKGAESLYRLGVTLANQKNTKGACVVFMSFAGEFPKATADLNKKVKTEAQKLGCK
ncbi:MAG: tetratricopeptide repeat protein [Alphaproteobacteria bacterium]|nr:tetratricopeptide repeat protein [Alphaproteobacteria bacterium]